jgi:hypothetical protein
MQTVTINAFLGKVAVRCNAIATRMDSYGASNVKNRTCCFIAYY